MTVIWSGITEGGAIVPVQVDETGRVVATQKDSGLDFWEKDGDVLKPSGGESVSVEGTVSSTVSFLGPTASFTADVNIHGLNVGLGSGSLSVNTSVGRCALSDNTTGWDNTAVGFSALTGNTKGNENTALGGYSLADNTTGDNNTAVGLGALSKNSEGNYNTAVGGYSLSVNTEGNENTGLGSYSLSGNTTGESNVAVGRSALSLNSEGNNNTGLGSYSLSVNTLGGSNVAVGRGALFNNTTGSANVAVGRSALNNNVEGLNNIAVGRGALSNLDTGSNNTFIGRNPGLPSLSDTICLSAGTQYRLWIDSVGQTGIGTNNPQATLDVAGPALFANGLCGFLSSGEIFFQSRNTAYKLVVSSGGLVTAEEIPSSLLGLNAREELVIPPAIETNND